MSASISHGRIIKSDFKSDSSWRAVIAAFMLNGLLFGAWAARVPTFKDHFDLAPGTLGVLLLALAGGAIVSFPLAGALSEKLGPKKLTIGCTWFYCLSLVSLAYAPSVLVLGIALFMFGIFHGAMDVAMNGWGAQVEKLLKRSTMSIFHAMFSLGAGVGAASGYVALKLETGTDLHFLLIAVIGGVLALIAMTRGANLQAVSAHNDERRSLVALPTAPLFFVGLIAFAVSMGEGAMADWSAVFLRIVVQSTEAQAALGYAVFSFMMVATRLLGGLLVERYGPVMTTRVSTGIAFMGVMIAILGNTLVLVLVGFALMGIGYAVVMPLVFSRAACDPDVAPGPALASVATLGYGGMLLGPPTIGFVAEMTGLRWSFLILAGLALLAVVLAPRLAVMEQTQ